MLNIEQQLEHKLNERKAENALRQLSVAKEGIDFFSNDYLGFAKHPIKLDEARIGSTGSRLISGNSLFAEKLETELAVFHKGESALLFNSGYDANLGLLSCVVERNDTIIIDELCHASIYDGIRLSYAKSLKFKHNDLKELEQKIKHAQGNIIVVVESVYSMDGDFSPLSELVELCKEHNAKLIVDEAHSTGIFGNNGEGRCVELGIEQDVFARVHTFGKAMGCHGAIVVGSKVLKDYLVNFSRSFIYTTALPEHSLKVIELNYRKLKESKGLISQLNDLINYFKNKMAQFDFIDSQSPIQSLLVQGNENVKNIAQELQTKGFLVKPILSPTVPKGKERIRFCLHVFNSNSEIDILYQELGKLI